MDIYLDKILGDKTMGRKSLERKSNRSISFLAILLMITFANSLSARAADINERWLKGWWQAQWCAHPDGPGQDPALFLFRKTISFDTVPEHFVVHVSADQRYQLFVNGTRAAYGPARGDLLHWRFETIDLAPYLHSGDNVIGAKVWSAGIMAPWAQITAHTAFILQGDTDMEKSLNTPGGWKVYRDTSWTPTPRPGVRLHGHVTGPNEKFDASLYPWDWMDPAFEPGEDWKSPVFVGDGVPSGLLGDGSSLWKLTPRTIPLMMEKPERFLKVVRAKGAKPEDGFLDGSAPLVIPAKSKAVILLDREELTNGYPEIEVSGGKGAVIRLSYEESLFKYPEVDMGRLIKGSRNDTKKCAIRSDYKFDEFLPSGGATRVMSPLWWRTFRFLQMDVRTGDEPLEIRDVRIIATGYPFDITAKFEASDPTLQTIWDTGRRTAMLCAGETYFDCPYYEQLQYGGDTRVQMMISYYMSGDDRLARNAIELLADSRMPEGLTMSRYPTRMFQVIPTFSLAWIGMIRDHYMMYGDDSVAKEHLWAMREILAWFEARQLENGLLGNLTWWNFVDWSWPGGVPPGATDARGSSVMSLIYVLALRDAADMEEVLGHADQARQDRALADQTAAAAQKLCWDDKKQLMADTPARDTYSQHAAILGVLAGAIPESQRRPAIDAALADPAMAQVTLYFRYYLHRAVEKAGLGDRYLDMLQPWRDMLDMGLTTWPETPSEPRSDCHAWSAAPTADLLSLVCGVKPETPGFKTVRIEPHIGSLEWVRCEVPSPRGMIRVSLEKKANQIQADIELPDNTPGVFVLNGESTTLKPGKQSLLK